MGLIKLLYEIIKDERGFEWGGAAGGAASGAMAGSAFGPWGTVIGGVGGAVLGGLAKKKKKEEIYDPYAAQRNQYTNYLSGKLGTSTPYEYNEDFTLDQPDVEAATEGTILGKLRKPTDYVGASKDITERAYGARKNRLQERFADEQTQLKDMYNSLGLVSSTPGLTAQTNLASRQGLELEDISAQLSYEDIAREMEAQKLADTSSQAWTGQGQVLGARQRGYQRESQQMSIDDLIRKQEEENTYADAMGNLLNQNPAERTVSYTPNTASNLLSVLQNKDTGSALSGIKNMDWGGLFGKSVPKAPAASRVLGNIKRPARLTSI